MKISTTFDNKISSVLRAENEKRNAEHVSSGKLSASWLQYPAQWQVLKYLGVPEKGFDDYTLRKFVRGNHVEDWVIGHVDNLVDTQKEVEYRDVIGKVDAVVNTQGWDFDCGVIPIEVKSVANAKYKWITKRGMPDRGHLLQGCLYALALNSEEFGILYVASDDYRVYLTLHRVDRYKAEIDAIIDRYNEALTKKVIPPLLIPNKEDAWMKDEKYNKFPDFATLAGEEALEKVREISKNCRW